MHPNSMARMPQGSMLVSIHHSVQQSSHHHRINAYIHVSLKLGPCRQMPPRFLYTPCHLRICNQFDAVSIVTTHHISMLTVQSFHSPTCHRYRHQTIHFDPVRRRNCFNHPEAIANHARNATDTHPLDSAGYRICICVRFSNWHSTQGCELRMHATLLFRIIVGL